MSQPEQIGSIVPRITLFVRKCGRITRLIWPATCINCHGKGRVPLDSPYGISCSPPVFIVCPNCEGLGYVKEK